MTLGSVFILKSRLLSPGASELMLVFEPGCLGISMVASMFVLVVRGNGCKRQVAQYSGVFE